jgi:hypothetical protein
VTEPGVCDGKLGVADDDLRQLDEELAETVSSTLVAAGLDHFGVGVADDHRSAAELVIGVPDAPRVGHVNRLGVKPRGTRLAYL